MPNLICTSPRVFNAGSSAISIFLLLSLAAFSAAAREPQTGEAVPVDGKRFTAALAGIDADWTIRFTTDSGPRKIAAVDLVRWGTRVDRDEHPVVLLADGGRLVVSRIELLTGDRIVVDSPIWGDVSLPLELVRGVVLKQPAAAAERDRLQLQIASAAGDQDFVLLENGDRVQGILRGMPDMAGPALKQPDLKQPPLLHIELDVKGRPQPIKLELANVAALALNPALVAPPRVAGMHATLGLDDGSLLNVAAVQSEPGLVNLTLPGGVQISTDSDTFGEETVFLRPATPRVVYLSDLRPIGYKHIPFLDLAWPFKEDRSVLGGKLRVAGQVYGKGLGMHSASRLAYELGGEYERFETELAIDDRAGAAGDGGRGSVVCRVFLDRGDGNWQSAYGSPVIRGGDAPRPVSIDVRGAKRMALLVEFADRGDECDYADWLNARLIR